MISVEIPANVEKLKMQIQALSEMLAEDTDEQSRRIHADALKASLDALEKMQADEK